MFKLRTNRQSFISCSYEVAPRSDSEDSGSEEEEEEEVYNLAGFIVVNIEHLQQFM